MFTKACVLHHSYLQGSVHTWKTKRRLIFHRSLKDIFNRLVACVKLYCVFIMLIVDSVSFPQCGLCKSQLGDATAGTDVRIRNGQLSCHECYIASRGENTHTKAGTPWHEKPPLPTFIYLKRGGVCRTWPASYPTFKRLARSWSLCWGRIMKVSNVFTGRQVPAFSVVCFHNLKNVEWIVTYL